MAKKKVRPHPGVLKQLLKEKNMTQAEVAAGGGIDRKTQVKIDRGGEVKLETLQKLADKLKVPVTYFDPPASSSVGDGKSITQFPKDQAEEDWKAHVWLSLLLRKVDVDDLSEMLLSVSDSERIEWKLNVRTVDDETISLLEQFEDAVKDLCEHQNDFGVRPSLRRELDELKKTKRVVSLMEELAKHGLAVFGATYVSWHHSDDGIDFETGYVEGPNVNFVSTSHVVFSIERYSAHEPRQKVWQGKLPPRFAPWGTRITVDGRVLAVTAEMKTQALAKWVDDVRKEQKDSNSDPSSEDSNAK
jgi:transcriptional regulator with XRE-family HTH domain